MFRTSKRRIVALIMVFLSLFLLTAIGIIYGVSYYSIYRDNQAVVTNRAERYLKAQMEGNARGSLSEGFMEALQEQGLSLTMFYAVCYEKDGSVHNIMNIPNSGLTDEEVIIMAEALLSRNRTGGIFRGFVYQCLEAEGYRAAVWMDNPVMTQNMRTLLHYTFLLGAVFILLMFPFAIMASRFILRPIEENEKKQRVFLANAEHELKTPITTIGANAELLSREIGSNRWLEAIRQENGRMRKMVEELLELSRTESVPSIMREVQLPKLVMGGVLPYETIAYDKGNEITTDIAENITVLGDERQLTELVAVLTENSVSHCKGSGDIRVSLHKEKGNAVFSISNPGEPLSEDDRERIFDRFYRVGSNDGKSGHFGLGLAIARAVVEAHGGKFTVGSEENRTAFTVTLPAK